MIRYLEESEKGKCRALWQEAFPEDREGFLKYYFNWKTADNQVLVKEDEKGRILTMAHLNPYQVMVRGQIWQLDYIVGVATATDSRHQGHMRDILGKMLLDMNKDGKAFCYLMPAAEALYRPFGFRYIFDQPLWRMKAELPEGVRQEEVNLGQNQPEEAIKLASWMNRWLEARYQVYALRDDRYVERLWAELESEHGQVYGWYDKQGVLNALQAFWGMEKKEQRFLYSMEPDWIEREVSEETGGEARREVRSAIMARITHVARMMKVICLDEEAPCDEIEVLIRIKDELIPGNQGLWRWKLKRGGSQLTREPAGLAGAPLFSTEVLDIDVASLTSWLFGYDSLERLMGENGGEPPWWCRFAEPLKDVFLDEIV